MRRSGGEMRTGRCILGHARTLSTIPEAEPPVEHRQINKMSGVPAVWPLAYEENGGYLADLWVPHGSKPTLSPSQRSPALSVSEQSIKANQSTARLLPRRSGGRSRKVMRVARKGQLRAALLSDLFHSALDCSTGVLIGMVFALYVAVRAGFAAIWVLIDYRCALDFDGSYWKAFYQMTYEPYSSDCVSAAVTLAMECCAMVLLNGSVVGILTTRLIRGGKRAETILFSDKAVIRTGSDGKPYFMFQIVEMRKHQLIEAHVRCYFFSHRGRYRFVGERMRLSRPDDGRGSPIWLVTPAIVVHPIDRYSPMCPNSTTQDTFPLPQLRGSDGLDGNRDELDCRVCGESFHTVSQLGAHVRYRAILDELSGLPEQFSHHCNGNTEERKGSGGAVPSSQEADVLFSHLKAIGYWEVVVLVEGIEPYTSSTVQARHSFTIDDLLLDATFAPCVGTANDDSSCVIDYSYVNTVWPLLGPEVQGVSGPPSSEARGAEATISEVPSRN